MTPPTHKNKSMTLPLSTGFLLVLLTLMSLQGCGGGGGNDPVVTPKDADPKGYFTGTALLNGGAVDVQDMVGLAYDKRLMVFSMVQNVLFDITMTEINGSDFTGTVKFYKDGVRNGSGVSISGTTSNTRIQGTFAGGNGLSTGDFDIFYDNQNNDGATLARVRGFLFTGSISGIDVENGGGILAGSSGYNLSDSFVQLCKAEGNFIIPDAEINIYQLAHDVVPQSNSTGCVAPYANTNYTGFASIISNGDTDDTFVFAYANEEVALFSAGLTK